MVRIFKYAYGIMTVALVILFAVSSIVAPALFSSLFYTILYIVYAVITLCSAYFIPRLSQKILHVLIACLILGVVIEKSVNTHCFITMGEGGEYYIPLDGDTLGCELLDFAITRESKRTGTVIHYESRIVIDRRDTVSIRVNHPFRYNDVRLYQSAYKSITPFLICFDDTLRLFEGQTDTLHAVAFTLLEFDPVLQRAAVRYNKILFYLPVGMPTQFLDKPMIILPQTPEIATVLEYVEVRGHTLLIIIAGLMLLALAYNLVKRK
ncbi:MAG: cytochrome c biogenesis protein ResB [Candidatus Marinimicrobia bacterium]|nr:cytochrome c biogenesis protein ResB [Candidatus Neomarinimicrobiota bacterium]